MSRSKKYCYIQFQFEYKAEQNEEVYVVGNVEDLGNWDISKAEKLVTGKLTYPIWKSKENIKVYQNSIVEYKYIFFKNGVFSHWETQAENRKIPIQRNMIRLVVCDPGGIIKNVNLSTVDDNNDNIYCNQGSYWEEHENSFLFTDDNFIPNNVIYKQTDNVNDAIYRIMSVNNDSSPFF